MAEAYADRGFYSLVGTRPRLRLPMLTWFTYVGCTGTWVVTLRVGGNPCHPSTRTRWPCLLKRCLLSGIAEADKVNRSWRKFGGGWLDQSFAITAGGKASTGWKDWVAQSSSHWPSGALGWGRVVQAAIAAPVKWCNTSISSLPVSVRVAWSL